MDKICVEPGSIPYCPFCRHDTQNSFDHVCTLSFFVKCPRTTRHVITRILAQLFKRLFC